MMRCIDVPEGFMSDRPVNVPPRERELFFTEEARGMLYMLDTDTASYIIKGRGAHLQANYRLSSAPCCACRL